MNDWSEFSDDWKRLNPDLTALARRVAWRGRVLRGYMWFQAIGTVFVLPIIVIWAYRTVPTTTTAILLATCVAGVAGWWAVALPVWRNNRKAAPPAGAEQVRAEALAQVRRLRPLIAAECVVGAGLALYVAGLWVFHDDGQGPLWIYLAGGACALLWALGNLRYWRQLGREAVELQGL